MAYPTITVLGKSSNKAYLRFFNKDIPVPITSTTKMVLELDTRKEISSESYPSMFNWDTGTTGVAAIALGTLWWPTRIYYAKIISFDDFYDEGLYWGTIRIKAIENANTT